MNADKEYIEPALRAIEPWLYLLPTDVQRKVKLAISLINTNGFATSEEMAAELGNNWVIASRRTQRIVDRYGEDVNVVSPTRYQQAERDAIKKRVPR